MKKVNYLFWGVVGAIGLVFIATIITAISQREPEPASPIAIPTPAEMPSSQ